MPVKTCTIARSSLRWLTISVVMHFQTVSLLLAIAPACIASKLPIVDLGYELHQALSFSVSLTESFSRVRRK